MREKEQILKRLIFGAYHDRHVSPRFIKSFRDPSLKGYVNTINRNRVRELIKDLRAERKLK